MSREYLKREYLKNMNGKKQWEKRLKLEDLEAKFDVVDKYMRRGHEMATGAQGRVDSDRRGSSVFAEKALDSE